MSFNFQQIDPNLGKTAAAVDWSWSVSLNFQQIDQSESWEDCSCSCSRSWSCARPSPTASRGCATRHAAPHPRFPSRWEPRLGREPLIAPAMQRMHRQSPKHRSDLPQVLSSQGKMPFAMRRSGVRIPLAPPHAQGSNPKPSSMLVEVRALLLSEALVSGLARTRRGAGEVLRARARVLAGSTM